MQEDLLRKIRRTKDDKDLPDASGLFPSVSLSAAEELGGTTYPFDAKWYSEAYKYTISKIFPGVSRDILSQPIERKTPEEILQEAAEQGSPLGSMSGGIKRAVAFTPQGRAGLQQYLEDSARTARSVLDNDVAVSGLFKSPENIDILSSTMDPFEALHKIDVEAAKLAQTNKIARNALSFSKIKGQSSPVASRAVAFDRLRTRLTKLVGEKHQVDFKFDPGNAAEDIGPGVWVTIGPKGADFVAPGMKGFAQFRYDIETPMGLVTRANGAMYAANATVISHDVIKRSGFARWKHLSVVSQGFYHTSSIAGKKEMSRIGGTGKNRQQKLRLEAQQRRNIGDMDVFFFNDVLTAHIDARYDVLDRLLGKGDYEGVQRQLNLALSDVYSKGGYAFKIDAHGLDRYVRQQLVNYKPDFFNNPFDLTLLSNFEGAGFDRKMLRGILRNDPRVMSKILRSTPANGPSAFELQKFYQHFRKSVLSPWENSDLTTDEMVDKAMRSIGTASVEAEAIKHAQRLEIASRHNLIPTSFKAGQDAMTGLSLRADMIPGGTPAIRPVQWFHTVHNMEHPLDAPAAGAHPRATNAFLSNSGYENIMSTEHLRYGRVGFVMGGSYTDANGQEINMDDEEAMRWFGAHEQQMIVKKDFEKVFGDDITLKNAKLFTDISKGMVQVTGNGGPEILDDALDIVNGVPMKKLLGKHGSGSTVFRGVLGRMLEVTDEKDQDFVRAALIRAFGDDTIALDRNVATGMLQATFKKRVLFGSQQEIEPALRSSSRSIELPEVFSILQDVNNNISNPIQLFRRAKVRTAAGVEGYLNVLDLTSATRISEDSLPGAMEKTRQTIHGMITPKRTSTDMSLMQIQHMRAEGLFYHSSDYYMRSMTSNAQRRLVRDYQETSAALFGTFPVTETKYDEITGEPHRSQRDEVFNNRQRELAESFSQKTYSPSELRAKGRGIDQGPYTAEEFLERYDMQPHKIVSPTGQTIYVPGSSPVPNADGTFHPSDIQRSVDNILQAKTKDEVAIAIDRYKSTLEREIVGKNGLAAQAFDSLTMSGPGVLNAKIAQDLWASGDAGISLRPGEAIIGESFFKNASGLKYTPGKSGDTVMWDPERNMNYVYTTLHRPPEVLTGRQAFKMYIDPARDEHKIYVHEFDRRLLYGDSDGDTISALIANVKTKHYRMTAGQRQGNIEQFERNIAQKQSVYEKFERIMADAKSTADPGIRFDQWGNPIAANQHAMGIINEIRSDPQNAILLGDAVATQQRFEKSSQGIWGAYTEPLINYLMGQALDDPLMSEEQRARAMGMANLLGESRELILKVAKSGAAGTGEFNPLTYSLLVRNKDVTDRRSFSFQYIDEEGNQMTHKDFFVAHGPTNDSSYLQKNAGETRAGGENASEYFQSKFVPGTKSYAGEEGQSLIAQWTGQMSNHDHAFFETLSQLSGPGFDIGSLGGNINHAEAFAKMHDAILHGQLDDESARSLGPVAQYMQELYRPHKPIEPFDLQLFANKTSAATSVQRMVSSVAEHKTWGGVGLAAAAIMGGGAIVYSKMRNTSPESMGQADMSPAIDGSYGGAKPPMGGRTRVMDNRQGGSAQSYNINISARNGRHNNLDSNNYTVDMGQRMGGSMAVSVADDRSSLDDNTQDDFINQLKGRG